MLKALRKKMDYTQFRSLDDRLTSFGFDAPRFAMDEFIEEMRPVQSTTCRSASGIARVTCSYDAWDEYQERKSKALKEQVSRGNKPAGPFEGEAAGQLMDMSMAETAERPRKQAFAHMSSNPLCRPPETLTDAVHWHVVEESRTGWIMYSECLATHDEALAIYADSATKPRWIAKVSFDRHSIVERRHERRSK